MKRGLVSVFLALIMTICIIPFNSQGVYAEENVPWGDLLLDVEKWTYNTWNIMVESEQKIYVASDIANEEYTLQKKPDKENYFVKDQEEKVLQKIPLDVVMGQTDNCVELMHILKNAVNGVGLSSSITKLNDDFERTIDTTLVIMSGFKSGADVTVNDLIQAYKYYTNYSYVNTNTNGVALAKKIFNKVQTRSTSMSSQINSLIDAYESNEVNAEKALNYIMNERDLDAKEIDKVHSKMDSILKKIDYLNEQKSALYDIINEYSKKYTDFSYQLPGEELTVTKVAAISSIYGDTANMFFLPKEEAAIIEEQQKIIQTAYDDVMKEMITLVDEIANTSTSTRDMDVINNTLIATRCCMRLIEVYLRDLSLFWDNTYISCQNMIDRFGAVEIAYQSESADNGTYIDFFKDKEFIEAYLFNIVNWTALGSLSFDGLEDFYEIREKSLSYRKESETDPRTHYKQAIKGAAALSVKMKEDGNQSLYSGSTINKQYSTDLVIVIVCGVVIICGGMAALFYAKKKKKVDVKNKR